MGTERKKIRLADRLPPGTGALLIIGGALLSVWFIYVALQMRLVIEYTSSAAPDDAVAELTLIHPHRGAYAAAAHMPKNFQRALLAADLKSASSATFFVRKKEGGWLSGYVTDGPVDTALLPEGFRTTALDGMTAVSEGNPAFPNTRPTIDLLPRQRDGWGTIRTAASEMSLRFTLTIEDDGAFRFTAGRRFRGLPAGLGAHKTANAITAFPQGTTHYYADDRHPRALTVIADRLSDQGTPLESEVLAILKSLSGEVEWMVAKPETDDDKKDFLIFSRAQRDDLERVSEAVRAYLGKKDPEEIEILLPDGSTSTEYRDSASFSRLETETLKTGMTLRTLTSMNGDAVVYILVDNSGDIWISTSKNLIQGALLNSAGMSGVPSCRPDGVFPSLALFEPSSDAKVVEDPLLGAAFERFERVVYQLNDGETGLFTVCGYF